ncbi:type II toxin-antitoxin system VapC family toxin [Coraliomargarita parva]|uniref:type II toxin-antitoxin system VapC family toxin n=1 Tax=Coraliomargarita parva TaxID=3014050 RepID=UPI0022B423F3|nr:type II toxin-antitoxin system VapC family toxin [Coraliomargarita parva]
MRALLDTHAALYAWIAPERLSDRAQQVIRNPANQLYFSQASVFEITLKYKLGKLPLPEPPELYLPSRIERFSLSYLPLTDADIFGITQLPESHKDPFDWLLLATARRLKVPIISKDRAFADYPVKLIW